MKELKKKDKKRGTYGYNTKACVNLREMLERLLPVKN